MRVAQVWRYPVKSMQGECLDALAIDADTVHGDRAWGVRDSSSGAVLTGRAARSLLHATATTEGADDVCITLPDGRRVRADDEHTDLVLSSFVGQPVHLARAKPDERTVFEAPVEYSDAPGPTVQWRSVPSTFNDGHPVHLLTTASLRAGGVLHRDGDWDVRRFRPNLLVDCEGDYFPEDAWVHVRIGNVELEVYKRTTRCVVTARAQPGLDDDLEVPRALARHRRAQLGVYARILTPGTVAVGDEVEVR